MQIYQGMKIATAKPDKAEMQGIPHHLMDFLPPDKSYSVAMFTDDAKRCITDISSRGISISKRVERESKVFSLLSRLSPYFLTSFAASRRLAIRLR